MRRHIRDALAAAGIAVHRETTAFTPTELVPNEPNVDYPRLHIWVGANLSDERGNAPSPLPSADLLRALVDPVTWIRRTYPDVPLSLCSKTPEGRLLSYSFERYDSAEDVERAARALVSEAASMQAGAWGWERNQGRWIKL
jgi:hypothetical protein